MRRAPGYAGKIFGLTSVFFFAGCSLLGKKATISISSPSGISDLCVTINSDSQKEAKTIPYTYSATEGETVSITAFTSSSTVATGSVTTRITKSCESSVTYSAKIYYGSIAVQDDYTAVAVCADDKSTTETKNPD